METKKLFLVTKSFFDNTYTIGVFSEKEKADQIVSLMEKGDNHYGYYAEEVTLDSLPFVECRYKKEADLFLQGYSELVIDYLDFSSFSSEGHPSYKTDVDLKNNFQLPIPKNGFSTTWENLFLTANKMVFTTTVFHRLAEGELENNAYSGKMKEKAIEQLREYSKDWFSKVVERYPMTAALIADEKISFYLYREGEFNLQNTFVSDFKQESEKEHTFYRNGKRYNEYLFETKNGQKFLDTILEKINNQA